jgi:UTP--glucose-1-phosphate uridylyltransferase
MSSNNIKKAIIPMAGLATRFLPLSKAVPKELWPIVDEPMIQKIVGEAIDSGIEKIIFVLSPGNKKVLDYLKPAPHIEKILRERKKEKLLAEFLKFEDKIKDISFETVIQKTPLGDGHAILQAKKLVGDEPVAVLFADDIVESTTPCLKQLITTFKTCQKPVIALYKMPKARLQHYGIPRVEKIANRFFKIKELVEKPAPGSEPSDLAVVGKYILTPEVFDYLKKSKPSAKGEVILAEVFDKMLLDGKLIYGYEFEGKWLECGNKADWLKTSVYLSLKDPKYGPEIKKFLKENNLL